MIEHHEFRELMGAVCTPVTVVTTMTEDGRPHGTTVSSFASLSLGSPLVSLALDHALVVVAVRTAVTGYAPPLVYGRSTFGTHSALIEH